MVCFCCVRDDVAPSLDITYRVFFEVQRHALKEYTTIVLSCCVCVVLYFFSEERLVRVMEEMASRGKCLQQSEELLQRFKKATNR